ncbi:MAG: hypothetical protein JXR89_04980 [Deltaproteobacteria bacterium]|nr:hypothetical protein [Deltaproteobacteria bacterium]
MKDGLIDPWEKLMGLGRRLSPVWLGCSGGIDSLWLFHFFRYVAKIEVRPVFFAHPAVYPEENAGARALVRAENGLIVDFSAAEMSRVWAGSPDRRCYRCKHYLFSRLRGLAGPGIRLCDGSHADDQPERRPGMRALDELDVISPLRLCGWSKAMIREAARSAGLKAWNQPARACLVVEQDRPLS